MSIAAAERSTTEPWEIGTGDPKAIIVSAAQIGPEHVTVTFADSTAARYAHAWLRDNRPAAGDKYTAIRSWSILADDFEDAPSTAIALAGGGLEVAWPDGIATFGGAWLRAHCHETAERITRTTRPTLWTRDEIAGAPPIFQFNAVLGDNNGRLAMLNAIADHGFVLLQGVPATAEGTEDIAAMVGYIRETDFGRVFDIVSEPEVWEMSQSTEALHPHTDDPYRHNPPGISVLHCIEADETGGRSQIVDGFAAAAALREEDPDAFSLLSTIHLPFVRHRHDPVPQGEDVHLLTHAPVISLDREGEICGIRFHERSTAPFDMDPDVMPAYYRAYRRFAQLLCGDEFMFTHHLKPGEAFLFDNQRALHGREAFSGGSGRRHLRICTMDRDQLHSRLRLAMARAGVPGHAHAMAFGAR